MKFSRKFLDWWQAYHQNKIVKYAKKHSVFYKKNSEKIIDKKTMMDNFSEFNTKNINKEIAFSHALQAEKSRNFAPLLKSMAIGLSSGTSGNRGLFLVSEIERLAWSGNILAKILPMPLWKKQKIALFLRANSALYESIRSKNLIFEYFDLLEEIDLLRAKLKKFDPDILVGPPSLLLQLESKDCNPIKIISVAEVLTKMDEITLEKKFNQKIFQIYQCTEGFLAFSCSQGTLHMNEDLVLIEREYIDEDHFVPIVTDLFRKTQPIIRYRLDDILQEKKSKCPCGSKFLALERIEGRCDDLLFVECLKGNIKPLFPDFVIRKIIFASEQIVDFEVVQVDLKCWEIYIQSNFRDLVAKSLGDLFNEYDCIHPSLVFLNESIKINGSKLRRVRREFQV